MVAVPDDRDRIAVEVVVLTGRRQRDVDRHRRLGAAQLDQGLSGRLTSKQGVLELAARQRGERRRAADGRAGSRNHRPDCAARSEALRSEEWDDADGHPWRRDSA